MFFEWIKANPEMTVAIAVYVIANVYPRPDAEKLSGRAKTFWQIVDRLCVLTAHKVPGSIKMPLLDSPTRGSDDAAESTEPEKLVVTHDDGEDDDADESDDESDDSQEDHEKEEDEESKDS